MGDEALHEGETSVGSVYSLHQNTQYKSFAENYKLSSKVGPSSYYPSIVQIYKQITSHTARFYQTRFLCRIKLFTLPSPSTAVYR
jgi:hypothetical protein